MLRKLIWLLVGVALGGAIYLAQRRAKDTGRGFLEVMPEVPGEARNAITACFGALANCKNVFVVDPDIDIFDDEEVDGADEPARQSSARG